MCRWVPGTSSVGSTLPVERSRTSSLLPSGAEEGSLSTVTGPPRAQDNPLKTKTRSFCLTLVPFVPDRTAPWSLQSGLLPCQTTAAHLSTRPWPQHSVPRCSSPSAIWRNSAANLGLSLRCARGRREARATHPRSHGAGTQTRGPTIRPLPTLLQPAEAVRVSRMREATSGTLNFTNSQCPAASPTASLNGPFCFARTS